MPQIIQKIQIKIIFIFWITLSLSSCVTTYETGFNHHKKESNIDFTQHNLAYQFSSDSLFQLSTKTQIDIFDEAFLNQFQSNLTNLGYRFNGYSNFQTITLQNCLIDFSRAEPKLVKFSYDSFYIDQFATTLICQKDSNKNNLFTATYDIYHEYEIVPKKTVQIDTFTNNNWQQSKNYYYHQKPITQGQANDIANNLSKVAAQKLDSLNHLSFNKNHPDLAAKTYPNTKATAAGEGILKILGIIIIVLFSVVITP